jgi:hypothetical protein
MVGTTATNRHKQPYHFLRCSVRNRRGKQECSQGDLPAEPIELMVLQSLVGVLQRNSPEVLPALRQLQQAADRASGPLSDQRKALGLERDRIAGEMANLGTLAAAGGPTARSLAKPLADRQMALEAIDGRMGEIDANLGLMGMRSLDAERVASELAADAETLLDAEPEVQARSLQALVQEVRLKKLDAKRWEVDLAIHLPRVPAAVFAQPSRLVLRSKLPSNPCPTLALAVQVLRVGQAWRVAIDPIRHARDMPTADIADQLGVTLRQAQRLVRKGHAAARLALS